jgi:hypothetical protein
MALAYAIRGRGALGDMWVKIVDITLDAAYAAGGYTLAPGSVGLGANGVILGVIPMSNPGFIADWDPVASKLRVRDASGGVGAATPEAANNLAALNGLVLRCLVLGRGSPG